MLHANVAHHGVGLQRGEVARHVEAHVVEGGLGLVDEHELLGAELGGLAHNLAAYAARRAGDEERLARKLRGHGLEVDLYLVAREEVFNVHLVELAGGEVGLPVPFLRGGKHHDLDARVGKAAHHFGIVADGLVAEGGDEEHRCPALFHGPHKALVVGIDAFAQQAQVGGEGVLVAHEAGKGIGRGRLVVDAAGQAHTALLHAVDEHAAGAGTAVGTVEEVLHNDAHHPHEHGGEHGAQHEVAQAQGHEPRATLKHVAHGKGERKAREHGVAHAAEVDEGGVADEAGVGVEQAETHDAEHEVEGERAQQGQEVLQGVERAVVERVDHERGEQHDGAVQEEDDPIRQGAAVEVPRGETLEVEHVSIFFRCKKGKKDFSVCYLLYAS